MIIPAKDRIILKRIEDTDPSSDSTIVIPDQYQQVSCKGKVVAVGRNFQDQYEPDDIVFFGQYNNEDIKIDGEEYQIVYGDDIRLRVGNQRKPEYLQADRAVRNSL
jgi:co-chaperonin GroES (HSP10)